LANLAALIDVDPAELRNRERDQVQAERGRLDALDAAARHAAEGVTLLVNAIITATGFHWQPNWS
jgi:hypothetical protein